MSEADDLLAKLRATVPNNKVVSAVELHIGKVSPVNKREEVTVERECLLLPDGSLYTTMRAAGPEVIKYYANLLSAKIVVRKFYVVTELIDE